MLNVRAHHIARKHLMWLSRLLTGTNARLHYRLLVPWQPRFIASSLSSVDSAWMKCAFCR